MKVTTRSTVSTLGVILGVCLTPLTAVAQAMPNGAPPTAGFADPTPEEQRALRGEAPAGGGSAGPVAPYTAPAPAPAAAPPPAYPARAPAHANTAAPQYTYTPPPQYAYAARAASPAGGYRYASNQYGGTRYGTEPGNGDPRADDSGGGSTKERPAKEEHFRIGVLGGVGFPRPLALEGMIKIERVLGLGLEYSASPNLTIAGAETTLWAIAATVRVFPFRDGFFLGLRGGRQHLGGEGTVTVAPYGSFRESVTVDSTFLNPRIGFLHTWTSGVTLGIDAGVQIPVGATVASSVPAGTGVDETVMDVAKAIGNSPLPTIDLLKLGFLL